MAKLDGPFTWHIYIGGSLPDAPKLAELRRRLEKEKISCYLKYSPVHKDTAIISMVNTGITQSQKCLLYISKNYLEDGYYKIETQKVIEKASRFSKDMVILLVDEELLDAWPTELPTEMVGYERFKVIDAKLDDEQLIKCLCQKILQEPSAKLSVLPKENVGYGSAFGYFYGFLRLVLPNFQKRLFENALDNDPEMREKAVGKMLIIMPRSCFCTVQMESPGKIEHTNRFVVMVANRAGNKQRDYKSSLYKIKGPEENEEYYFVGELATPLLTMFEMYHFGLAGMTKDQLYLERDAFYFALKAILSHPDNRICNNQFRLLYWNDPNSQTSEAGSPENTDNSVVTDLYDFLLPIVREEVANTDYRREDPVGDLEHDSADRSSQRTFEPVVVSGSHPGAIYESLLLDHYNMDKVTRGMCLIINIENFMNEKGVQPLLPRRGAKADSRNLVDLFQNLRFDVKLHNDVTLETMEKLLLTMHLVDHKDYDAFVCCILTHGKLGVVYTSDNKPLPILQITEFFSDKNCPSLSGKPKMFFIQACQKGTETGHGQPSTRHPMGVQVPAGYASDVGGEVTTQPGGSEIREKILDPENLESSVIPCPAPTTDENVSTTFAPLPPAVDVEAGIEQGVGKIELMEDPLVSLSKSDPVESCINASTLDVDASQAPGLLSADGLSAEIRSALIPGYPDFLMSYSTLPGSISFRDTMMGSLYIQALCESLKSGHEIDRCLKMVTRSVKSMLLERGQIDNNPTRFQLPFHLTSGMDKLIYL